MTAMPPEFLASFRDSMPLSYRQHQTENDILEHAQIAWRRGEELAHAEIWSKRSNAVVICVVSDDRPGLGPLIRATVAAHELNVCAEQVYSRNNERGRAEVVHFLWLELTHDGKGGTAVSQADIVELQRSLCALLRGETDLGEVIERVSSNPPAPTRAD
jgi:hypothetical protein